MSFNFVKEVFLKAVRALNTKELQKLDPDHVYSGLDKEQFIEEIERDLSFIRARGIAHLQVRPSQCEFCYPTSSAFSFHHVTTGEFLIRYVIHQESPDRYIIEECRNKVLPDGDDGLPF